MASVTASLSRKRFLCLEPLIFGLSQSYTLQKNDTGAAGIATRWLVPSLVIFDSGWKDYLIECLHSPGVMPWDFIARRAKRNAKPSLHMTYRRIWFLPTCPHKFGACGNNCSEAGNEKVTMSHSRIGESEHSGDELGWSVFSTRTSSSSQPPSY